MVTALKIMIVSGWNRRSWSVTGWGRWSGCVGEQNRWWGWGGVVGELDVARHAAGPRPPRPPWPVSDRVICTQAISRVSWGK